MSNSLGAMSGEVKEVGRTPHVPIVDEHAHRDRPRKAPHREPPPSPPEGEEQPPAPGPGKVDILA